jgi:hypothetical protein
MARLIQPRSDAGSELKKRVRREVYLVQCRRTVAYGDCWSAPVTVNLMRCHELLR